MNHFTRWKAEMPVPAHKKMYLNQKMFTQQGITVVFILTGYHWNRTFPSHQILHSSVMRTLEELKIKPKLCLK